jgi:hypothetical protein
VGIIALDMLFVNLCLVTSHINSISQSIANGLKANTHLSAETSIGIDTGAFIRIGGNTWPTSTIINPHMPPIGHTFRRMMYVHDRS